MPLPERARRLIQAGAVFSYAIAAVLLVTAFLDYWGSLDAPTLGLWPDRSWLFFLAVPFLAIGGFAGWYAFQRPGPEAANMKCRACGSVEAAPASVCSHCAAPL